MLQRIEDAASAAKIIQSATVDECKRLTYSRRKTPYRREDMDAIVGRWRSLPPLAVLIPMVVDRDGKKFSMVTTQVSVISSTKVVWNNNNEMNLMIDRHEFFIKKRRTTYDSTPQFSISTHAVSRWYQRACGVRDDAALLADLVALVQHRMIDIPVRDVSVPVQGGTWLGHFNMMIVTNGLRFPILEVRTFI